MTKLNLRPVVEDTKGWNRDIPSRAVIANGDNGCVLWWVGFHLDMEIMEAGLSDLEDLSLDDAPPGISIWEGKYMWQAGGFDHPDDGECFPVGIFRAPTDEEWARIRAGEAPWDEREWRVEGQ